MSDPHFMYRWCSYCQSFIGECEPRNVYEMTHGICLSCKGSVKEKNHPENFSKIKQIKSFFDYLRLCVQNRELPRKEEMIVQAKKLEISPSDLLVGVIQPVLVEIGELYEAGKLQISFEHQFTRFADQFIDALFYEYRFKKPIHENQNLDVLLVCADGNHHFIGIRMIELLLLESGYSVHTVFPGLPFIEVLKLEKNLQPKVVGISVMLEEQFIQLKNDCAQYRDQMPKEVKFVLGGRGVQNERPNQCPNFLIHDGQKKSFLELIEREVKKFDSQQKSEKRRKAA